MKRVLIIDDDTDICLLLKKFLSKNGFEADHTTNGAEAVQMLKDQPYHLVLCDYRLPDTDGLEMLQRIKIIRPDAAIIIITGYSDIRVAVKTLKMGAYDYVTKPLYPDEILVTINEAIKAKSHQNEAPAVDAKKTKKSTPEKLFIYGESSHADKVKKHIHLIAPTDMSVIIEGETGTGKEFVANEIHKNSKRKDYPFIAIDCGALPKELAGSELFGHVKGAFTGALNDKKGSFEMANGGTLFLDEIGNLSYENQMKLLRVLQEKKIKRVGGSKDISIDVRIITATNEDLKAAVKEGKFREDIFHRLNEFKIELSPLRERKEDIMIFARHFLDQANADLEKDIKGFDEKVVEKFKSYVWHGNLRELKNVIKRSVLLTQGDEVRLESLPPEIITPDDSEMMETSSRNVDLTNLRSASESAEKKVILNVLEKAGFNKTKAAEMLNVDRKTLYNKLKAYNIKL